TTHVLNTSTQLRLEPCTEFEGAGDPHFVPHYLPGKNPYLSEWLEDKPWIPKIAAKGGAETTYPEYGLKLDGKTDARFRPPVSKAAMDVRAAIIAESPHDGQV